MRLHFCNNLMIFYCCFRPIAIQNPLIEQKLGHIKFFSATYRLWKLPYLEPDCEDYGQVCEGMLDMA